MSLRVCWIIILILATVGWAQTKQVSCVGDSITYGSGITDRNENSYPAQLQDLLLQVDITWRVTNFGVSGATLLRRGDRPYIQQSAYQQALDSEPDVVIIKLGTNDTKPQNWVYANDFVPNYCDLIDAFRALPSQPEVWICKPVPAFALYYGINPTVIREEVLPMIEEIAALENTPVIDLYTALLSHDNLFPDTIHPNAAGAAIIAQNIASLLLGVNQPVDFHADGLVNLFDLAHLANQWKLETATLDLAPVPAGDGFINELDLRGMLQTWLTYSSIYPGIVAHWRLDETEGNIAQDAMGKVHGALNGDPIWHPQGGMLSGAIELDGIDDYVTFDRVLNPRSGPFTIFAWVQGGGPNQVLLGQGSSAQNSTTLLGTHATGALMTEVTDGGRTTKPLISDTLITDGAWHSIRFVWDGTHRSLYVDDQLIAEDTRKLSTLISSTDSWLLGSDGGQTPGTFWSGWIDDVRIHDIAIPVGE